MNRIVIFTLAATAVLLSGCSWVKLDKTARNVAVVKPRYVKGCEYLGMVSGKVFTGAAGVQRSRRKVSEEIQTIARNNAASMGGDSVVPAGRVAEGRQKFKVYRCGR